MVNVSDWNLLRAYIHKIRKASRSGGFPFTTSLSLCYTDAKKGGAGNEKSGRDTFTLSFACGGVFGRGGRRRARGDLDHFRKHFGTARRLFQIRPRRSGVAENARQNAEGKLEYDPDARCDHHEHHDGDCGHEHCADHHCEGN